MSRSDGARTGEVIGWTVEDTWQLTGTCLSESSSREGPLDPTESDTDASTLSLDALIRSLHCHSSLADTVAAVETAMAASVPGARRAVVRLEGSAAASLPAGSTPVPSDEQLGLPTLDLPLQVPGRRLGSVILHVTRALDEHDDRRCRLLSAHASSALAAALEIHHLRRALAHRHVIGQAKGILMERHQLTSVQAFTALIRASQHQNHKLADVAAEVANGGPTPGTGTVR